MVTFRRSVREAVAGAERKANSQEEDDDQEVYIKPLLQRVVQLRGSFWTDTGRQWWERPSIVKRLNRRCRCETEHTCPPRPTLDMTVNSIVAKRPSPTRSNTANKGSSAFVDGPRDALSQSKCWWLLYNCPGHTSVADSAKNAPVSYNTRNLEKSPLLIWQLKLQATDTLREIRYGGAIYGSNPAATPNQA